MQNGPKFVFLFNYMYALESEPPDGGIDKFCSPYPKDIPYSMKKWSFKFRENGDYVQMVTHDGR